MEKASVALCIPTYERSEWIADFLENYARHYIEAGIDIYYYDGSESSKTEEVVRCYPKGEHIFYIKRTSDWSLSAVFQGYGFQKEYDFVWLCGDGLQLKKDAINILMNNLSTEYDIVEINGTGYGPGTRIFHSCNEYMQRCAWHLGLFGAVLLNTHTMLDIANWDDYSDFFTIENAHYGHVSFYFNRILELNRFCVLHLSMDPQIVRGSKYKKYAGWYRRTLQVCCEKWVEAIDGLPDYYTDKDKATIGMENMGALSKQNFCSLRIDKIYSLKEYIRYRHIWSRVTTVPRYKLFILALIPGFCIKKIWELKIGKSRELKRLQKFCCNFSQIIIFGIGDSAFRYSQYFEEQGMEYKGFCAQRPHGKKEYMKHPIFSIDDVARMESVGMIVALGEDGAKVAIPDIAKKINADSIYFSADLEPVVCYELGYGRG